MIVGSVIPELLSVAGGALGEVLRAEHKFIEAVVVRKNWIRRIARLSYEAR